MDSTKTRATCWSVTINMKNVSRATAEACLEAARSKGWGVQGQLEKGEEGTEHYQLMVKTPQERFSAIKKVFPTAHIEVARNQKALAQYVNKDETCVEKLKKVEVTFLTYQQVRKQFFEWVVDHDPPLPPYVSTEARLEAWDRFIGLSIEEGMDCDLIGMNPQHRGCISKYWFHYIAYVRNNRQPEERRQPDSQTSLDSVVVPIIPNAL